MEPQILNNMLVHELNEIKATEILNLTIADKTPLADFMLICTASSSRHAKAIVKHVQIALKAKGIALNALSGEEHGEWVIMDYGSTLIHIMQSQTRAFYNLEGIWENNDEIDNPANES